MTRASADGLVILRAEPRHLEGIVLCLADDTLGGHGDTWSEETRPAYEAAFEAIRASADQELIVGELDGSVVAMAQLRLGIVLAGGGARAAELVSLFVRRQARGLGVGEAVLAEVRRRARQAGASKLTLISNKARVDAHRFYEKLGFARSHEGFKMRLD